MGRPVGFDSSRLAALAVAARLSLPENPSANRMVYSVVCQGRTVPVVVEYEAGKVVHIGKPYYNYVQRAGSITNQKFTKKRVGVLEQVEITTQYILNEYPDLKEKCDYFFGVKSPIPDEQKERIIRMAKSSSFEQDKSMFC